MNSELDIFGIMTGDGSNRGPTFWFLQWFSNMSADANAGPEGGRAGEAASITLSSQAGNFGPETEFQEMLTKECLDSETIACCVHEGSDETTLIYM